VEKDQDLGRLK